MATKTTELPPAARRQATMNALAELAQGNLAEEVRLDMAARLLRTARKALEIMDTALPLPAGMAEWDPRTVTAREHAEALRPAELDRLLAEGPRWAAALLRVEPELRRAA